MWSHPRHLHTLLFTLNRSDSTLVFWIILCQTIAAIMCLWFFGKIQSNFYKWYWWQMFSWSQERQPRWFNHPDRYCPVKQHSILPDRDRAERRLNSKRILCTNFLYKLLHYPVCTALVCFFIQMAVSPTSVHCSVNARKQTNPAIRQLISLIEVTHHFLWCAYYFSTSVLFSKLGKCTPLC